MKNLFIVLYFISLCCFSQEKELCKTWIIDNSLKNKTLSNEIDKDYFITFYENNKFESIEDGVSLFGTWKLDVKKMIIILSVDDFPIKLNLKIIKLDNNNLVWSGRNIEDGKIKKIFMKPKIN